jgi:hypothetical protein
MYAKFFAILLSCLVLVSGVSCTALLTTTGAGKPTVQIIAPPSSSDATVGQPVSVQVLAVDDKGVTRVELYVDGALRDQQAPPVPQGQPQFLVALRWTPTNPGTAIALVRAFDGDGNISDPAAISLNIAVAPITPSPTALLPTLAPPTPVPPTPVLPTPITPTLPPTAVPSATATTVPTAIVCTNSAELVEHVTVPPGTLLATGQTFNKIWRVRNTGTCAWGAGYQLVFVSGAAMTAINAIAVPVTAPGATADLLIAMAAPITPGAHSSTWQLRAATGALFGAAISVDISVISLTPPTSVPPPGTGCAGAPNIGNFSASQTTIRPGAGTKLSWDFVSNADYVEINPGIGGVATPGDVSVYPTVTTTYTLVARCGGSTRTKSVTITVNPATPAGDLILQDVFLTTSSEVVVRAAMTGSLSGSFQYRVFAGGQRVALGSWNVPVGSQAFYTGYFVSGTQTIRAVIDSNNDIPETNEGNNEMTKSCNSATHTCS